MATQKTGVLLKVRGSVGGVNFYDRLGVQCLRNKPQRSEHYVSSPAQAFQQGVFKAVADFSKSSYSVTALIRGGWGAKKRGKGRSGYNNFSSEVLRKLSRNEAGTKVDQAAYEANLAAFNANPGGWMHENIVLTMSKYASLPVLDTLELATSGGAVSGTITVNKDVFDNWLRVNARQYGVVNAVNDVKLILGGDVLGAGSRVWYKEITPTKSGDDFVFTLPADLDATAGTADMAFAFYATASGVYGKPADPAVTQYTRVSVSSSGTRAARAKEAEPTGTSK